MTRSIPSIIVLTLMCFTISYGLVRFPEAGILDAAQGIASSGAQKEVVLKPTLDGSALSQDDSSVSSALPASNATSDEPFITESTTPPTKGGSDEEAGLKTTKYNKKNKNKTAAVDVPENKTENDAEKSESNDSLLPALEDESDNKSNESADSLDLISAEIDYSAQDNSMPIETDEDPLQDIGPLESDLPPIQVPSAPLESEQTIEPIDNVKPDFEQEIGSDLEPMPKSEQPSDDFWDNYLNENSPTNSLSANSGNSQTDSASSSTDENQSSEASKPTTIQTDPNAYEIPARNRETKPVNKDALTQPAIDEQQNGSLNGTIQKTGTIPIETFPLDLDEPTQKTNFTIDYNEPYDKYGFDIPAAGPIVVKRLPSVDNSVDPIYNNAQLDRFAL